MRQAASIVCIGGANVDRKARLLTPFRLGTSHPVVTTQTAGGVARNVAENLGRFGHTVSLVSTVGDDRDGQWLIDVTSRYVNTSFIMRTSKANTGTYTAVLDECGEMVLALADMVIYDTVGKEWMKQRWPELGPISAVVLDTNFPKAVIRLVIEQCRQEDIPLCVVTVSAPKVKRLPSDLSGVTWLITNEAEAKAFVGREATGIRTTSWKRSFTPAPRTLSSRAAQTALRTPPSKGKQGRSRRQRWMSLTPPERATPLRLDFCTASSEAVRSKTPAASG